MIAARGTSEGSRQTAERIDSRKLKCCVVATARALADLDPGPDVPAEHSTLLAALDGLSGFPAVYCEVAIEPFRQVLTRLGVEGLAALRAQAQGDLLIDDLAQALSQRQGGYYRRELLAFQEVVDDLFDGFLSREDRRGLKSPDQRIPAPLVKWGRPGLGPYAFGHDQMAVLGVGCGLVSLPGAVARADGLFAWGILAHEVGGHGIIACERGLLGQLAAKVEGGLAADLRGADVDAVSREALIDHWTHTLEETAADVLGVLNMGPAAAAAALVLIRAGALGGDAVPERLFQADLLDRHPISVLRLIAMAEVLRRCGFGRSGENPRAERLAAALEFETRALIGDRDLSIDGRAVSSEAALLSARTTGGVIACARTEALGGVSLRSIQTWRDRDERLVERLRRVMREETEGSAALLGDEPYAAHAVAAALLEALYDPKQQPALHQKMIELLLAMHEANSTWGPLGLLYSSDLAPRRVGGIPRKFAGGIPRKFAGGISPGRSRGILAEDSGKELLPYPLVPVRSA